MRESSDRWITNSYPLVDAALRRSDCEAYLRKIGWPVPKKSSCRFCPYHSDRYWRDLKHNHAKEFEMACEFDELIRDMSKSGVKQPVYLHRSLKPLRAVKFDGQPELFSEECAGVCGV